MKSAWSTPLLIVLFATFTHADEIDFARDIRPILSENCSFCHGPDEATREAGLRLDTPDGVAEVIDGTDSDHSELYRRLISEDESERMPPPDSNRKLTGRQIRLLRDWIEQGARWDQHWSFRMLERPALPELSVGGSVPTRNPIDRFVQKKLAEHSIEPSAEADRRTLIRRLTLDLNGLPPTVEQVETFLNDDDPRAYERLVDRLLESPAYGQRMAWDWLDAARYADTNGYQGDRERSMWPWRDWVVRAFNQNLPYDQFTIWQLAGDLLPDATHDQRLATGFCRNHMINGEGGRIAEENRVEYVMDMSETMGTLWLGLTLNCCRCHDHKYDPITNREYYQFFAFFNQTPVKGNGGDPQTAPVLAAPDDSQRERLAAMATQLTRLKAQMEKRADAMMSGQSDWEREKREALSADPVWRPVTVIRSSAEASTLRLLDDGSLLAEGNNPDNDTYTLRVSAPLDHITGLRIDALQHPTMTKNGLARSNSGNFVLTGLEVRRVDAGSDDGQPVQAAPTAIRFVSAEATFEQGVHVVGNAIDDKVKSGWAVYQGRPFDRGHSAVFTLGDAVPSKNAEFEIVLRHDSVHKKHNLGHFRVSVSDATNPTLTPQSDGLLTALRRDAKERSGEEVELITRRYRESDKDYQALKRQYDDLKKRRDEIEKGLPKVMVMADMSQRRPTYILERGLYNKPTDEVAAALPEFLPAPPASDSENRLTLSRWLVSDDNPLTARVTVNRFWQQVFGIGLVKTSEDFGAQGELPVHRELLDWLAVEFRDSGWDVKHLMRLIVTSHTYRQSSKVSDSATLQLDPENRLLSRSSRYRMPAWMLRDQALAISGLMSPAVGGPAVNTYQPPGVWEEASFGKKKYSLDQGEKLYRRSLYTFWRRIAAPTMFFDNASRQTCTVRSGRTNTPLHALQTLNNVAYVEAARALAELALKSEARTDGERIDYAMRRAVARPASAAESRILSAGLQRTRDQFSAAPGEAAKLLAVGQSARDETLSVIEHASWTALCSAILNLDETLTRE